MSPERLDTFLKSETEAALTSLNQKRSLRKPVRGLKAAFAAATVGLTGIIAATAASAENPQNYQEPTFPGNHSTKTLTEADLLPLGTELKDTGTSHDLASQASTDLSKDTDGDGCTDAEETSPVARFGGQRDPANPWDFFDLNGDKKVNIFDIQMVAYRFGYVKGQPLYNPKFDRSVIGPNNWNLGPGDGVINLVDLGAGFVQNQHQCGQLSQVEQGFAQRFDELTADTTPPEIEGVELWQLYCYPSREAYEADAVDNELNPPEECSSSAVAAATDAGLGDIIKRIDREGPICIEDPIVPPTPACKEAAPKTASGEVNASSNYDPFDCWASLNAIWETDFLGNPVNPGTHYLWAMGTRCPKKAYALGQTAYSQCYRWDTRNWACTTFRGSNSSDIYDPYSSHWIKKYARYLVYVPPYYGLNCRRLKVGHWVLFQQDPLIRIRNWNSYSSARVCY